jgi:TetR/AcrR family transcriptional repressor of nem operon
MKVNKAERTRKFIIEKSAGIINKKGMSGTSISDIIEATKLTKGGIYGNFESKDEICLESFSYLADLHSNELDKAIMKGNTAKAKLHGLLHFYKNNNIMESGCHMLNFGVEADDTHPQMKANVKKAIIATQKRILDIVSDGISNNEVSPTIDPKNFSVKVFALLEGGILCKKVLESDEQMKTVIETIKKEFEIYLL